MIDSRKSVRYIDEIAAGYRLRRPQHGGLSTSPCRALGGVPGAFFAPPARNWATPPATAAWVVPCFHHSYQEVLMSRRPRGFTLVELLVVIAIIGMLIAL